MVVAYAVRLCFLFRISAIELHGISEILVGIKLIGCDVTRRCAEKRGNTVDYRSAGMLDRCGLYDVEFGVRLARNLPVAHIAVIGTVDLAYSLLFNCNALHRFDSHDGGHSYAASGFDSLAESLGINIAVNNARHVLLVDGFNCQPELVADSLACVPGI